MVSVRVTAVCFWALLLVVTAVLAAATAEAVDMNFNSSEPGCDGSDPNVLMCDDFERGFWATVTCDYANGQGPFANSVNQHAGWCMSNNFSSGGQIANSARGPNLGAAETSYTATSGVIPSSGGNGINGFHNFKGGVSVTEIYVRFYLRMVPTFTIGHQKILVWDDGGVGSGGGPQCCILHFPWGSGAIDMQVEDANETRRLTQNQGNTLAVSPTNGHWYYVEIHIKLNTGVASNGNGVFEFWLNDCGAPTGTGCTGSPTLRARYTDVRGLNGQAASYGQLWFEQWSPVDQPAQGEIQYDQLKVSTVGPIGFAPISSAAPPDAAPTGLSVW